MIPWRLVRAAFATALIGAVTGALSGCGGGGDGSPPPAPDSVVVIAETAEAYWNAEPAARWVFDVTDSRPGYPAKRVNMVTVAGTTTFDGRTVTRFAHSSSIADAQPDEELRYFDGRSIYTTGDLADDPSAPLIGSYAELPAPLVADVPKTVLDRSESFDEDGDGLPDFRLRLVVTVALGTEASRTVPAGTFSNLVRARTEATATVTILALNESVSITAVQTAWYAAGVGIVRRELVDPDPDLVAPNNVVVEELSGVSLAALKAGKVPGFVALDAIGAGNNSSLAGFPSMATDGTNVLVVSRATDPSGVAQSASLVGALLAPDGSVAATRTLVETSSGDYFQLRSAAAFDGLNYQAFWVRPDGALVGQRLSAAGDVLGPAAGLPVPDVASGSIGRVAAASDGNRVLLVWQRFDGAGWLTEGRLLDRNGLGISPIFSLATGEADVSVAWSGAGYLIARANPLGGSVGFVRVSNTGAMVDPNWQELAGSGPYATDPRVIAHPDGFLVGWTSWASPPRAGIESLILSRRVASDGSVLDAADIVIDGIPVANRFGFALTASARGLFSGWVRELILDPMQSADRARAALAPWIPGTTAFDNPAPYWGSYWYTAPSLRPPRDAYPVAVAAGDRFVMGWLENLESSTTPSDRVVATIVYPPAAR